MKSIFMGIYVGVLKRLKEERPMFSILMQSSGLKNEIFQLPD